MRRARAIAILAGVAVAVSACRRQDDTADVREAAARKAARANLAAAPAAFAPCLSCHTVERGRNGSGPSLVGVFGRRAGGLPGYPYSAALAGSKITWDRGTLDRWLTAPMRMVPGTRMVMPMPDPIRRKAVIDYLEALK